MFGRRLTLVTSLVVGLVALVGMHAARATTMVPLDLKALTQRADRVVYATVESTESHWTKDHDAIYTDVRLRVQRVYKGAVKPGDQMVVRREGGTVDGVGMHVFGAPGFTPGEELVAFVEQRGSSSWVVGMAQGKLRVTTMADGSKLVHPAQLEAIHFLNGATPPAPTTRTLDDFEREVKSYAKLPAVTQ